MVLNQTLNRISRNGHMQHVRVQIPNNHIDQEPGSGSSKGRSLEWELGTPSHYPLEWDFP